MSASKQATKRLQKEHVAFQKSPPPFIWARPFESNILEWHYILRGPPDTPYHGGEFWGVVTFPPDYPFAPPGIKMNTPSGRFAPSSAICTSMSNFHPGSWNPAWSVNTILVGLLSFMSGDEITTGSIRASDAERKALAAASHAWNIAQAKFRTMFPEYSGPTAVDLPVMGEAAPPSTSTVPTPSPSPAPPTDSSPASPPDSAVPPPTGLVGARAAAPLEAVALAGQEDADPVRIDRRSFWTRWRKELLWALTVLLVSWMSMKVLGEA